jgi:hypothetical protein
MPFPDLISIAFSVPVHMCFWVQCHYFKVRSDKTWPCNNHKKVLLGSMHAYAVAGHQPQSGTMLQPLAQHFACHVVHILCCTLLANYSKWQAALHKRCCRLPCI